MARMAQIAQTKEDMNGALAIFAKTIGLSPYKTRLATDIGAEQTQAFYTLSLEAISEVVQEAQRLSGLTPHWALAEVQALNHSQWQQFNTMWTGDGGLGERLHQVYQSLQSHHDYVILIGSDSPQLSSNLITKAIEKLEQPSTCVIGPALDGGFYLFAARQPLAKALWCEVNYSQSTTLSELTTQLVSSGIDIQLLPMISDVDNRDDLSTLLTDLNTSNHLLPAQQKLRQWLIHTLG